MHRDGVQTRRKPNRCSQLVVLTPLAPGLSVNPEHHQSHEQRLCLVCWQMEQEQGGFPSVQVPKLCPKAPFDKGSLQSLWQHL